MRLLVNISLILEVGGVLLDCFGSRSGDDLGSKIDVDMDICNILESMLSLAWEHGFFDGQGMDLA